ncbi:MAG: putative membrane protein [Limisphaerales bacterium]|jgi:putative membrane protein
MADSKKLLNPVPSLLKKWLINALALMVAGQMVSGVNFGGYVPLVVAAFFMTLLHEFVRPVIYILTLPLMVITLTMFRFVINALLLIIVGALVMDFEVNGFGAAFWGALMVSLVSTLMSGWSGIKDREYEFQRRMRKQKTPVPEEPTSSGGPATARPIPKDDGGGPIIDV